MINGKKKKFEIRNFYASLISNYVNHKTDVVYFEREYFKQFKEDLILWRGEKFEVLNSIFTDLDSFCDDLVLRNEYDLDEKQLRQRCKSHLLKLNIIIGK